MENFKIDTKIVEEQLNIIKQKNIKELILNTKNSIDNFNSNWNDENNGNYRKVVRIAKKACSNIEGNYTEIENLITKIESQLTNYKTIEDATKGWSRL